MMLWIVLLMVGLAAPVGATTITASTCSDTDVSTAISSAVDGDTVVIPAGTCTWTSLVTFTGKSITLKGVGSGTEAQCAVGGQTTYTCIERAAPLLNITTKATGNTPAGYFDLSYLTIRVLSPGTGCSVNGAAAVSIYGHSQNLRVHHTVMSHETGCGLLLIPENVNGVIDHNTFIAKSGSPHVLVLGHRSWSGTGVYGDNSWATDDTIGQVGNLYVEDNSFDIAAPATTTAYSDNGYGCRVVWRFNTFGNGSIQTHGTESGGRGWRGCRHIESYRNNHALTTVQASVHSMRGVGTFRTFDNKTTGSTPTNVVDFNTYRAEANHAEYGFYPWAFCGKQTVVSITRSGTTATVTTPNINGITHNTANQADPRAYINISGADQAEYNGTAIQAKGLFAAISTSSAANPTLITTSAAHGFETGDKIRISGHSVSSLNSPADASYYTITVIDATSFTIPVNSTGGTGGFARSVVKFIYTVSGTPATPATGTITYSGTYDGNTDNTGYPCLDQVGRGKGTLLSGDAFTTQSPTAPLNQALAPAYIWNNTKGGTLDDAQASAGATVTIEERDFYNQNASFTGATGIGRGTRASRPATCTAGTAYWSTDGGGNWNTSTTETYSSTPGEDGALDLCSATNTWTNDWYVPYTYPHFLIPGGPLRRHGMSGGARMTGTWRMQ